MIPIRYYCQTTTLTVTLFLLFFTATAHAAVVRFYDENLGLIETRNYEEGAVINFSAESENKPDDIAYWYPASSFSPLNSHTITGDINLYSVPKVKEIRYEFELRRIDGVIGDLGGRYMLVRDISLTKAWQPIGNHEKSFMGVFNGGGHKISGLWTDNKSVTDFVGLFGRTSGAVIRDISVTIDVEKGGISGRGYIGGIVGIAVNTKIFGSSSEGLISGKKLVGGIAGYALNSMIKDSSSICDIIAVGRAGGIAGGSYYTYFENVRSSGTITLKDIDIEYLEHDMPTEDNAILDKGIHYPRIIPDTGLTGGIVGYAYFSTIVGSHFMGQINGRDYSGGIVGHMVSYYGYNEGGIVNCSFTGSIEGGNNSGGIAGSIDGSFIINSHSSGDINGGFHSGGIVGELYKGNVVSSSFKGTIKGTRNVGGIVGYQDSCALVGDSYAQGDVAGEDNIGGIVGFNIYGAANLNHFSGSVKGVEHVGGIAGYNRGDINNSYSEGVIKGEREVGGIVGVMITTPLDDYESSDPSAVSSSYSSADISGKENVGGIVGSSEIYTWIKDIYFTGKVRGEGKYTGGIAGYNGWYIVNGYALGSVEGGEYAGGIAGYTKSESLIYNHSKEREEFIPAVSNNLAANSLIKGVNTARIAAVIDGEQTSVPHNFALSTLKKGVKNFSEGDARNGISKSAEELKKKETYSAAPPEGLGWKFGDSNLKPWTMEGSTTGYPILYWQVKKPGFGRGWYCEIDD